MIRVWGANFNKVRLNVLRSAKTGHEWLPEINVNESHALTETVPRFILGNRARGAKAL